MATDEELLDRLDRIATILGIGFSDQLERARSTVREDSVDAAVLDVVRSGWVTSGEIKRVVTKSAKVSDRTVQRSLAGLVARGYVRVAGAPPNVSYRSSGVL